MPRIERDEKHSINKCPAVIKQDVAYQSMYG